LIHDLSNNEEGFLVYREDSYTADWSHIATLSANSQSDWISFTDGGLPGITTYYVSAFNSQGEASSNPAMVNIDPVECPPELGKTPGYTLEISQLFPEIRAGMNYCYFSTDGTHWSRWPQLGFLPMGDDGIISGGPLIQILDKGINEGDIPTTPRFGIFMECWGWQNGILVELGDFLVEEINPEFFGSQIVPGEGLSAEVEFKPVEIVGQPSYPEAPVGSDLVPKGSQPLIETSISPVIPHVYLHQTIDPDVCGQYLPPHAQNPAGQAQYCFVYPQFDPNQGGVGTQPYLWWDFGSPLSCLAGSGENCSSYAELLAQVEETGGVVGFDVTSVSNAGVFKWAVTEPFLKAFVVPPLNCTGSADYTVRMWYKPGFQSQDVLITEDQPAILPDVNGVVTELDSLYPVIEDIYYGMQSNVVSVPCKPIVQTAELIQFLDVTFKSLELHDLDDGESDPQDVEVYGYLRVVAPSMAQEAEDPCAYALPGLCDEDDEPMKIYSRRYLNLAEWDNQYSTCPDEVKKALIGDILVIATGGWFVPSPFWYDYENTMEPGCTHTFFEANFDLSSVRMCQATTKYECKLEGTPTSYAFHNNTLRVTVDGGDALTLEVKLVDWDDASANDLVCEGAVITPSKSLAEWANTHDTYTIITSTTDSGQCNVEVEINAVIP
jgi:hypothetical protein